MYIISLAAGNYNEIEDIQYHTMQDITNVNKILYAEDSHQMQNITIINKISCGENSHQMQDITIL